MINLLKKGKQAYILSFFILILLSSLAFTLIEVNKYEAWFTEKYKIKSPYIPAEVEFACERMPIEDSDIKERFDREIMATTFWQSNTMMLIKRSKKYFPIIEQILKENNIPDDFKYLCVQESGLSNAVSPAGARGFWQLMEGTAKPYGLEMNSFVDERYHLEKSTMAACQYFKESYAAFNNWTLTAASYNRGLNGTVRDLSSQGVASFYDLYMNEETSRYIFRILAYKLIFENPEMYGFYLNENEYYYSQPRILESVDSTINNLASFAKDRGTNYKMLKLLNPWLRDKSLPNKANKIYQIELPFEK